MTGSDEPNSFQWRAHVDEQFDAIHESLRALHQRQTLILELLTPEEREGPSLDDLLARIVTLIADQRPVLRRIDHTTGASLDLLEGRTPRSHPGSTGEESAEE
ncbi:hypothetical protein [Acetobacter pasteurianus]|uniref:hypothetical protein n=1 Tax=Acetobacter pasteurianus TaxID=438 RepID=UPI003D0A587A